MKDEIHVLSFEEIAKVSGGQRDFLHIVAATVFSILILPILVSELSCKCVKQNKIDQIA